MSATPLIRIHLPQEILSRIDALTAQARQELGANVSRAAVVRALVYLYVDKLTPELLTGLKTDVVKRGRPAERSEP